MDIENLHPQLFQAWIGQYDGQTKFGQKFQIFYNGKKWSTGEDTAPWIFWTFVNHGKVKDYVVDNKYHRIQHLNIRSIGNTDDKARIRADFTFKNLNGDWVPLGR